MKTVNSRQIEGWVSAHHKLVVNKEDAKVFRGTKISNSPNDCWNWDVVNKARDKLSDGGRNIISGFNKKGEYEIHWWEAEVVLKENGL